MADFNKAIELIMQKTNKFYVVHDSIVIEEVHLFTIEEIDRICQLSGYIIKG